MIGQCMPPASPRVNATLSRDDVLNPKDAAYDPPDEIGAETEDMEDIVTSTTQDPGQPETRSHLELAIGEEMEHPEPESPVERGQRALIIEEADVHVESLTVHARDDRVVHDSGSGETIFALK